MCACVFVCTVPGGYTMDKPGYLEVPLRSSISATAIKTSKLVFLFFHTLVYLTPIICMCSYVLNIGIICLKIALVAMPFFLLSKPPLLSFTAPPGHTLSLSLFAG